MEGISGDNMRKGLKEFWKKKGKGYGRLYKSGRRRKMETVELGGGAATTTTSTRRKRWRIKISRKIRIPRIPSPKKLMLWLRDAYVRMMMSLANSKAMSMTASATGNGGVGGYGRGPPPKEYDDKMLVHMYKSLMVAQGRLVPCEEVTCTRFKYVVPHRMQLRRLILPTHLG
ncbi:hypothetical protein RIF29_24864 [Crotalaria pallida]|uniref:Uncharacterized protein n=1 Tax=Crotalaria pallida TaxID=3830 RepID=A0AAN9EKH4_CROPI